jgi:hypothetical protein
MPLFFFHSSGGKYTPHLRVAQTAVDLPEMPPLEE